MIDSKLGHYLYDLGILLKERARDAKAFKDKSKGNDDYDFNLGKMAGYQSVLSIMQMQAKSFDIAIADIGLDDIDPENELF